MTTDNQTSTSCASTIFAQSELSSPSREPRLRVAKSTSSTRTSRWHRSTGSARFASCVLLSPRRETRLGAASFTGSIVTSVCIPERIIGKSSNKRIKNQKKKKKKKNGSYSIARSFGAVFLAFFSLNRVSFKKEKNTSSCSAFDSLTIHNLQQLCIIAFKMRCSDDRLGHEHQIVRWESQMSARGAFPQNK